MWGGPADRQTDNEAGQEQKCNGSRQAPSRSGDQLSPVPSYCCRQGAGQELSPDGGWSDRC